MEINKNANFHLENISPTLVDSVIHIHTALVYQKHSVSVFWCCRIRLCLAMTQSFFFIFDEAYLNISDVRENMNICVAPIPALDCQTEKIWIIKRSTSVERKHLRCIISFNRKHESGDICCLGFCVFVASHVILIADHVEWSDLFIFWYWFALQAYKGINNNNNISSELIDGSPNILSTV